MRIQHNIMAMNAYRNYTNNVSAMKSNLEKLSSGYKINRAGDDAAGLAISEKMRAQITGLQQAQSNAKSGINLVQTAEGALTEVHDMLNRMVKLADQSANGTFDDTTDRTQLQKEINQLLDEINRIADSANFNGIKLLDGSMNSEDIVNVKDPTFVGQSKFANYGNRANGVDTAKANEAQLHKDAAGSSKTHFEFDFNGRTMTANDDGEVQFDFGILRKDMADGSIPAALWGTVKLDNLGAGATVSAADLAKAVGEQVADSDGNVMLNFSTDRAPADDGTAAAEAAEGEVQIQYKVTVEGSKVIFDMTEAGYTAAAAESKTPTLTEGSDPFQGNFTIGMYPATGKGTTDSTNDVGSSNVTIGSTASGSKLAETVVNLDDILVKNGKVQDGAGVKIGDEYYVFAAKDDTLKAQYGDNVKVVDIRDLVDDTGAFKATADLTTQLGGKIDGITRAISRLTDVASDNKMFDVQHPFGDTAIAITERIDNPSDADLTTKAGIEAAIQKFDGIKANVETKKATGKALTLQIGDTSESFNQLKVNIADMHADALGIGGIDISNQDSAAAAVDKIRAAINKVSDVRGTLGATQNRLDHTINNLSVMTENIQDAESTIRDVDVAEEMMAYTKNNILIQSAQAMLAQANQVPQGVLQLLQ